MILLFRIKFDFLDYCKYSLKMAENICVETSSMVPFVYTRMK